MLKCNVEEFYAARNINKMLNNITRSLRKKKFILKKQSKVKTLTTNLYTLYTNLSKRKITSLEEKYIGKSTFPYLTKCGEIT